MSRWYKEPSNSDIIVASKVRLARNLNNMPFLSYMSADAQAQLCDKIKQTVKNSNTPLIGGLKYIDMNSAPEVEIYAMSERYTLSRSFADNFENTAILVSNDEKICVSAAYEDHLHINSIMSGLSLNEAYDVADRLDTFFCEKLKFAFDERLGYLTESPSNLGTGMTAFVILHLPMLDHSKEIYVISEAISKIGLTLKPVYTLDGNDPASFYQLSNRITLGISEREALDNLTAIASQISQKEEMLRSCADKTELENRVWRAYGLLSNSRILSTDEMLNLTSLIKIGASMGIINIDKQTIMQIMTECQPYMMVSAYGITDKRERDIKRAEIVRQMLNL